VVGGTRSLVRARAATLRAAWLLAGLAVAVQTAAYLVDELVLGGRYRALDAAVDASPFGRAETIAVGATALVAAVGAARRVGGRKRRALLAAALGFLALDDALGLHDRIRALPTPANAATGVLFGSLLALVLALLLVERARAPIVAHGILVGGLVALVAAVGVRLAGAFVTGETTVGDTVRVLGVAAEQGLDLGGWILLAAGLAASLRASAQPSSPAPH
jgi:hypothetical protein